MKRFLFMLTICLAGLFGSCADEKLGESIFDDTEITRNEFDKWLLSNYTYPYNIDFKYRMEDIESDRTYTLVPADVDKSIQLAKLIKHLWLEPYDELVGINFTRSYIPKVIHLVGSAAYNLNNSIVLGTAEAGLKVTLYTVNTLTIDPAYLNERYFKTMHHEFGHILNQTIKYDPEFAKISDANYIGADWVNRSLADANSLGFISQYARSSHGEDFVEMYSIFITNTQQVWDNKLTQADAAAQSVAEAKIRAAAQEAGKTLSEDEVKRQAELIKFNAVATINQKFEIVMNYMKNVWNIDVYKMRDIVQRRNSEIFVLDLDKL